MGSVNVEFAQAPDTRVIKRRRAQVPEMPSVPGGGGQRGGEAPPEPPRGWPWGASHRAMARLAAPGRCPVRGEGPAGRRRLLPGVAAVLAQPAAWGDGRPQSLFAWSPSPGQHFPTGMLLPQETLRRLRGLRVTGLAAFPARLCPTNGDTAGAPSLHAGAGRGGLCLGPSPSPGARLPAGVGGAASVFPFAASPCLAVVDRTFSYLAERQNPAA